MTTRTRILIVDDDPDVSEFLQRLLTASGYDVRTAATLDEGREAARRGHADVALLDVHLGEHSGFDVLHEIRRVSPTTDIVMITGYPSVQTAVDALREGASDYLTKPIDRKDLRRVLTRILERRQAHEGASSRAQTDPGVARALVGSSPAMDRVRRLIQQVASVEVPVLIEGESGTGKEVAAVAIHRASPRHRGPFIPVNCGAIPSELIESEFFGHVRGAFSGAVADSLGLFRSANGGTLFLDEIAELSLGLQVKLLRVLQEREVRPVGSPRSHGVDVRVIAATNRSIDAMVRDGTFRQDLFYRLNVVRIEMPPLRERREDIPLLVQHFLDLLNERFGRQVRGVEPDAMRALTEYRFPGNVRELENILERAYTLGARERISRADLPAFGEPASPPPPLTEGASLEALERDLIQRVLRQLNGDRTRAASALGMSERTLYRRLRQYGIS